MQIQIQIRRRLLECVCHQSERKSEGEGGENAGPCDGHVCRSRNRYLLVCCLREQLVLDVSVVTMDTGSRLGVIFIDTEAHVERYGVTDRQVKESFLTLAILTNCRAADTRLISGRIILLSVPAECVGCHPRTVSGILRVPIRLIRHGVAVPLDSVVGQLCISVMIVIDVADVDGVFHLVLRAA